MRRLLLVMVVLAGCGDDDDGSPAIDAPPAGADAATPDAARIDAAPSPDAVTFCDPVAQDCGAGEKCTLVSDAERHPECLAVTGSVTEDMPCVRDMNLFGHDDCAAGLFCTFLNVLPPSRGGTRLCQPLCDVAADCAPGELCATFDDVSPPHGVCGPPCTPFGTDCGMLNCSDLYNDTAGPFEAFLVCRATGTSMAGDPCDANAQHCAPDHVCIDLTFGTNPICHPLCDASHLCPAGGTCNMVGSHGVGICS